MKVRELKKLLSNFDGGAEVLLASDEEGNSFHKLHELDDSDNGEMVVFWPGLEVDV